MRNDALEFAAHLKNLFSVGQHLASGLGEFQLPAHALKQWQAVGLLKQADLPTDGLGREVQLFTGADDAAGFGNNPEVAGIISEHLMGDTS